MKKIGDKLRSNRSLSQVLTVLLGLVIICLVFGKLNPQFFSGKNIGNLLRQIAPILLIGVGQSFVLITGNIDLSIGSVIGMSCMISATLMTRGITSTVAVLITLAICLVIGLLNGVLVSICKLPPFIATLGTMTIGRGIAQIVNNNYNTDSIGQAGESYQNFFYYGKHLGIYNSVWITLVVFIVLAVLLSYTKLGRHIYAVGSNIEAARLSGVSVFKTTTIAYVISAFLAALAGLIMTATSGMGTMDAGTSYELYAVAASVIGGVSTLGGHGIIIGTAIGASIWGVLQNGLQFAGAPVAIRNIIIGVVVIVSVLLDILLRRRNS